MTEGHWLLTHLANTTKWVKAQRDYAFSSFTVIVDDSTPLDELDSNTVYNGRMVDPVHRDENGTFFIDLRLQYHDTEIVPHSGLSDYDQDHHGVWSLSAVEWCNTDEECADIALSLLKDLYNEITEE